MNIFQERIVFDRKYSRIVVDSIGPASFLLPFPVKSVNDLSRRPSLLEWIRKNRNKWHYREWVFTTAMESRMRARAGYSHVKNSSRRTYAFDYECASVYAHFDGHRTTARRRVEWAVMPLVRRRGVGPTAGRGQRKGRANRAERWVFNSLRRVFFAISSRRRRAFSE